MKIKLYNQNLDKYSRLACVPYGIGIIMLLKFGIYVTNNFLLKALILFEKAGKWSSKTGAVFDTFYSYIVVLINSKLGLKTQVVKKTVYTLNEKDTGTWGLGIIYYHQFGDLIADGIFDKNDVDKFIQKKGVPHHICWDGSNGGYLINTNGSNPIKCSLETLKYMATKGMIRSNIRTIEPTKDQKTKEILAITRLLFKAELINNLDSFIKTNKGMNYFDEALKIFNYGRK